MIRLWPQAARVQVTDFQLNSSLRTAPCNRTGSIVSYCSIPHLVVVLVEHDNNLGHVVQLWDSTQIVHGSLPLLVFVFLIYTHKQLHGISNSRHLAAFSEMGLSEFLSPQGNIVRTNCLTCRKKWPCNVVGCLQWGASAQRDATATQATHVQMWLASHCDTLTGDKQSPQQVPKHSHSQTTETSTRDEPVLSKGPSEMLLPDTEWKMWRHAEPLGSAQQGSPLFTASQHCQGMVTPEVPPMMLWSQSPRWWTWTEPSITKNPDAAKYPCFGNTASLCTWVTE